MSKGTRYTVRCVIHIQINIKEVMASASRDWRRRLHSISFSLATTHKALTKHRVKPTKKFRKKSGCIRYERPTPGDQIQIDTCKIRPGLYQHTSIGDCIRYRVLRIYKRCTAVNTLEFIDCVTEEIPFLSSEYKQIQGGSFFAMKVQLKLMELDTKFRPNKRVFHT